MLGALESTSGLTLAEQGKVTTITGNVDSFLNNQAEGYAAFVDGPTGLFRGSCDISEAAPAFSDYIDRIGNEFRGAIAFLATRYASSDVPDSVWNNLVLKTNSDYVDRTDQNIDNLAAWDGGAFQVFWPSLRNNERDFIGFRNALYNMLVTQLDYAYQNRIPGILSASALPEGGYAGAVGIPQIAEANSYDDTHNTIVGDIGSTYALAGAMDVDISAVLGWLDAIKNMSGMNSSYGIFDSARSASEISESYYGVDVASAVLGLSGTGPEDFETYLRNRPALETEYNRFYDEKSKLLTSITRTSTAFPNAPQFPDRSLAVFSNFASQGNINNFSNANVDLYGTAGLRFHYGVLPGNQEGGRSWMLDQHYNAQANQLLVYYSTVNSPKQIRIELKNNHVAVCAPITVNVEDSIKFGRLMIDLPDDVALSAVDEIDLMVDQADSGDVDGGDFTVHAIDFQHVLAIA